MGQTNRSYSEQPNFSHGDSFKERILPSEIGQAVSPSSSEWHSFYLLCKQCATQGLCGSVPVTVKETFTNYN